MATKEQVFTLHRKRPSWDCRMIAEALDCDPAYVRATFYRSGLSIPAAMTSGKRERERCAQIAERLGAPNIAKAIRIQEALS